MKAWIGIICVPAFILAAAAWSQPQVLSEYVVIANKQLQGSSIKLSSLKGIYLREIRNWGSDGQEIVAVDLPSAGGFYQDLFGKSRGQMQAYWLNMRIRHSADLPISKQDAESVKQFVAENKCAIGFIRHSDIDGRVKILKVVN